MRQVTAFLVLLVLAPGAAADFIQWLENGSPRGVVARPDGVTLVISNDLVDLATDGSVRSVIRLEAKTGRHQIESATGAREGMLLTSVHSTTDFNNLPAIVRVGAKGDVLWARTVDAFWTSWVGAVAEAVDGDVFAAFARRDAMVVLRLDPAGELRWARTFDRTDRDSPYALVPARDGGVLVISAALSRAAGLIRLDAKGAVVWERAFGSSDAAWAVYSAIELADGGFMAVGRTRNLAANDRNGWLARLDAKGDIVWQKTLGGDGEDGLYGVAQPGTNAFTAIGGLTPEPGGKPDTWLVLFDGTGTITSEAAIGTRDQSDGPVDPQRAYISASGDDVAILSVGHIATIAGRFRTLPADCKFVRRIETVVATANAIRTDTRLVSEPAQVRLTPIELITKNSYPSIKPTCTWTAGSSAAKPAPEKIAVEPPSEESLFADRVAALLAARKFVELDALGAELRTTRKTFDTGRSLLRAFYRSLASHATLSALPNGGHRGLLDAWQTATGSATSRIAFAGQTIDAARLTRGDGFYDSLLPSDVQKHRVHLQSAMAILRELDQRGTCDAPCYELMIKAETAGGWSEPLRKLHAVDPLYWEAFDAAIQFSGEGWGGTTRDIPRVADVIGRETRKHLGEAAYALAFVGWVYGVAGYRPEEEPAPPDWPRVRTGFRDFLRLHPNASWAAHAFASAAYHMARDRATARELFASPLLEWHFHPRVWRDRAQYERAKAWANAEPVDRILTALVAGRVPPRPLVARDGDAVTVLVTTANGPVAITTSPKLGVPKRAPAPESNLRPLVLRETELAFGDVIYIAGPQVVTARIHPQGIRTTKPVDWKAFVGSPVFDDTGAVAGVVILGPEPYVLPDVRSLE